MSRYGRAMHRAMRKLDATLAVERQRARDLQDQVRHRLEVRRSQCARKKRYDRPEHADAVRARREREAGYPIYRYGPCPCCMGYHLSKKDFANDDKSSRGR